ncbi:MAG: M20/M25/M40 family metallo-hydrolase [Anaerolineaceae bacterium]|nr:M20/M25/M40 family metallo-hydrolase [Anaerolineaceae bacterium]
MNLLIPLLVPILFLIAFMLLRTLRLRQRPARVEPVAVEEVDEIAIAHHLSEAIQIPTVSTVGMKDADRKPLLAMHEWIKKTYPLTSKNMERLVVNGFSLLYIWKGTDEKLKPVLFNAHLDVVPVAEDTRSDWQVDPFGGEIKDGSVWGRGTLDMKNQLVALLESSEALLKEGYRPKRTIYLAFGHDEEISGFEGSQLIVEKLN